MKLDGVRHRLDVTKSILSGSVFNDVNLSGSSFTNINMSGWILEDVNVSGLRVHNANLAGARIDNASLIGVAVTNCMLDGMTINGVAVADLLQAYEARNGKAKTPVSASATKQPSVAKRKKTKASR